MIDLDRYRPCVDTSVVSTCCNAYPVAGTEVDEYMTGFCSDCREGAAFEPVEDEEC